MKKFLSVSLNPAIDQIVYCDNFKIHSKNIVAKSRRNLGGKGRNIALALKHLGQDVSLLELLGEKNQDEFSRTANDYGINPIAFVVEGSTRTNIKIIDGSIGKDTELNEKGIQVKDNDGEKVLDYFRSHCKDFNFINFSGSLPMGIEADFYKKLITIANESGTKCALDTSGKPLKNGVSANPTILHVNIAELKELLWTDLGTIEEIYTATQHIIESGVEIIIVSMGSKGSLINSGTSSWYAKPPKVKVLNTIGAGDIMLASCINDYALSKKPETMVRNATALATLSTTYMDLIEIDLANLQNIASKVELTQIR